MGWETNHGMLAVNAYSVRKQVLLAVTLSLVGGFTNALTFICCSGTFTSHMTGNTTNFGRAVSELSGTGALYYGGLLVAFFVGAAASGIMTESAKLLGRQSGYVLPLAIEAVLLSSLIAIYGWRELHPHIFAALPFIATFAMGLQNATITKISGSVVRTTHVTGVVTDLGLEVTQYAIWYLRRHSRVYRFRRTQRIIMVSRRHPSARRLFVLYSIFLSFIAGVIIATVGFSHFECWGLILPIVMLCALIVLDWLTPISEIRALDPTSDPTAGAYGLNPSDLPRELAIYRMPLRTDHARVPSPYQHNWVDRIPSEKTIVVLVFAHAITIRSSVIADLRHLYYRMHAAGKTMLVAGLSPPQYRILNRRGIIEKIGVESVHPDLEFAVAYASGLLSARGNAAASTTVRPKLGEPASAGRPQDVAPRVQ